MVEDNQYFVQAILNERTTVQGNIEYLIHWQGYPRDEASWELAEGIDDDLIAGWNEDRAAEEAEDLSTDEDGEDRDERPAVPTSARPVARPLVPVNVCAHQPLSISMSKAQTALSELTAQST